MNLQDLSIKDFLAKTAGSDPVPGGGSIAALCGTLAAALAEMVTGLTIGRKKYADVQAEMEAIAPRMAEAATNSSNISTRTRKPTMPCSQPSRCRRTPTSSARHAPPR